MSTNRYTQPVVAGQFAAEHARNGRVCADCGLLDRHREGCPTMKVFRFASGATRTLNVAFDGRVRGLDGEGRVVVDDGFGFLYGLTLCCNAYDKGMEDGVYCRACFGEDSGAYYVTVTDPLEGLTLPIEPVAEKRPEEIR